jgi:AbrB family looped-hinge helix DNA binding protein
MDSSVITRKGQVVIPAKIRRHLGLKDGTRVNFYEQNGEIRMVPITAETIDKNIGMLGLKGKMLNSLMEDKERERQL